MLAVFALSFTSCKDDKEEVKPTVEETEIACKMTSLAFDGEEPVTLKYNEQGNISGVSLTLSNGDGTSNTYTTTYIYDGKHQLIRQESYTDGKMNEYTTYEYENGLQISAKNYEYIEGSAEGDLLTTRTYKYDAEKRAVEITVTYPSTEDNYFGGRNITSKITYDSNGNIEKIDRYNDGVLVSSAVYTGYDDKLNPYSVVKGLLTIDEEVLSKNNPGKRAASYFIDSDGDGVMEDNGGSVSTFTYEYNSEGYPVKITKVYEGSDDPDVTTYSYECK